MFGDATRLPGSHLDDNEGDFLDFDNDGDLDLYVSSVFVPGKLYRNVDDGVGSVDFELVDTTESGLAFTVSLNVDMDAADLDGDGDYDFMVARDTFNPNVLALNTTQVPDTTPPWFGNVDALGPQSAGADPIPLRVAVYDNAPYYVTWYDDVHIEVSVDGCRLPDIPATSSGGQLFRAEVPGNLVGNVELTPRATDEHGNTATAAPITYSATTALAVGGPFGAGTDGSLGEPQLSAASVAFPGSTLHLSGSNLAPGTLWFLSLNSAPLAIPLPVPGVMLLNVGGIQYLLLGGAADAAGCALVSLPLGPTVPSGLSVYFQLIALDGTADLFASSKGLEVTTQ